MARGIRFDRRMSEAEALMWVLEDDPVLRSTFANVTFLDRLPDLDRFRSDYAAAFERYLAATGESELESAYELGRSAVTDELGLLDFAGIHHAVLAEELTKASSPGQSPSKRRQRTTRAALTDGSCSPAGGERRKQERRSCRPPADFRAAARVQRRAPEPVRQSGPRRPDSYSDQVRTKSGPNRGRRKLTRDEVL